VINLNIVAAKIITILLLFCFKNLRLKLENPIPFPQIAIQEQTGNKSFSNAMLYYEKLKLWFRTATEIGAGHRTKECVLLGEGTWEWWWWVWEGVGFLFKSQFFQSGSSYV